ncbi:MAG: hypothetical protein DRI80_09550, partial [Chloroflexota bacterium]
MSQAICQLALPLETHRNHYLFSDYYLNELLPHQLVWREVEAEAQEALESITRLYDQKADALPHYKEAALEQEWIRPILDLLGHVYHVQPSLPGALGTPDYAFFTDEHARQAVIPALGTPAFWETALAVGDAKRWDRPLDKRIVDGAPDAFTNANPCYQIDYYLRRTGCAWGMISNGRRWRLYHRDTSFRLDVFYEVDLVQLIEQGDLDAFRYFYLFFRAAAFRPDAEGRCWLDEVLAQSTAYAVRVGDELKGRVYEALRLLAQGFLDYPVDDPDQALDPATDLPRVHDGCLILLYRLLFLLYAESRGLLPLDNPGYAGQYSLKAIKEDIARKLDAGVTYLAKKATLWDDLRTLFDIIYSGQETLGVPAYDGRLFDPARYPFLEEHTIGDRYLAQAIDLLARTEAGPGQGLSFVDYRDLSIRHLGSIYEGLLEYRLAYAAEEMAAVRKGRGKGEEIVPASEVGEGKVVERIPVGQVYLVTDRGERKATGSYYTPDYIVKYIVEQTLGPLVDAQAEAVEKEIAALKAKNKGAARRTKAYNETLARLQNSFADRVLALKVLDPAMGSGHFLVEATDYLARRIVEAGVSTDSLTESDEESELSYWRRRAVERCSYGVDLNPLAVELAKLSLWLATVAKGKPLSFLDHHLRCGNSLIGARVADLQALPARKGTRKTRKGRKARKEVEPQQLAMWDEGAFTQDMYRVVGAMRRIGEYETADLISVKEKERLFEETVERERRKWRAIADLWTATYFGLELVPEMYNACVQYAQGKEVLLRAAQAEEYLAQAHRIWEEKRFFHWEIEFPEVFFDEYGRHKGDAAGFDAVVGNPPYIQLSMDQYFDPGLKLYLLTTYESSMGRLNTFGFFLKLGMELIHDAGYEAMIVPNTVLTMTYYAELREMILDACKVRRILTFDNLPFEEAVVENTVLVLQAASDERERVHNSVKVDLLASSPFQVITSHEIPQNTFVKWHENVFNPYLTSRLLEIRDGLRTKARSLGELVYINQAIALKHDRAKWLFNEQLGPDFKPLLDGRDIDRYHISFPGVYLKYDLGAIHSCKREDIFLTDEKLFFRRVGDRIIACYDDSQFYALNTLVVVNLKEKTRPLSLKFLLTLLNSRLLNWYFVTFLKSTKEVFSEIQARQIEQLPIRRITFTTPPEERERLVGEGITEATEWIESTEGTSVE